MTPDLFTQLIDENSHGFGLADTARQLAQRLRHQPRLQSHKGIAHFTVNFSFRDQRGHGVDDNHIDGATADQGFGDLECLFTGIWL